MCTPTCICGRPAAKGTEVPGGCTPRQSELLRRLETIRELKMDAMRCTPPAFRRCIELGKEAQELRAELGRLAYPKR